MSVEFLGPTMQPFLDRYYSVADWRLAAVFSIRAEHASGYVERIVNDKRALMKSRPLAQGGGD